MISDFVSFVCFNPLFAAFWRLSLIIVSLYGDVIFHFPKLHDT